MVYKKRPQRLHATDAHALSEALLAARQQLLTARATLPWGCPHDHALQAVAAAIDALAVMLRSLDGKFWRMESNMSQATRSPIRSNRPNTLDNPFLLLGDLRALREALRTAQDRVAVGGPMYQAIEMVGAATAMAAALLSGDPAYWVDQATSSTDGLGGSLIAKRKRESDAP